MCLAFRRTCRARAFSKLRYPQKLQSQQECIEFAVSSCGGRGTQKSGSYHEEAILHLLVKEASQRLEHLPHGAITYDDDPLPFRALRKVRGIEGMQLACMRLIHLPELLQQQHRHQHQRCAVWPRFRPRSACSRGMQLASMRLIDLPELLQQQHHQRCSLSSVQTP